MPKSIFLELYERKDNALFWESDLFFALLDRYPVSPGHSLLIPKRHIENLADLNLHEKRGYLEAYFEVLKAIPWGSLQDIYSIWILNLDSQKYCEHALASVNLGKLTTEFNVGWNDGVSAGRSVNHVHMHVIPRFQDDVEAPRGGLRHVFSNLASY